MHDLVRRAGNISVLVMAGEDEETPPATTSSRPKEQEVHLLPYIVALGAVIGATAAGFALRQFLNVGNIALVFISAITFVAARFGLAPSLFACAVASLVFNFFFLPPVYRKPLRNGPGLVFRLF